MKVDAAAALPTDRRTEFSVHPARRGVRREHLLVWESEPFDDATTTSVRPRWPNLFSRHLGDKAFGLLVGGVFGLPVPRTTVIARRVRPFAFGEDAGATETWLRTCPLTQEPGKFTTLKGWTDPFKLLAAEDPRHDRLASVPSQQAVPALWSGAALTTADGTPIVEGVRGAGDSFMLGVRGPEGLPAEVAQAVRSLWTRAVDALGPVRFEWAFDGRRAWLLQLHAETSPSDGSVIYAGEAAAFVRYDTTRGLEGLRDVVTALAPGEGVVLDGAVGLTSPFADLLRKARVPSRIAASPRA